MTNHYGEQLVPLRNRRTRGKGGEEAIASTLYCPVRKRSVGSTTCEGCAQFHAFHFEPASCTTSVVCGCKVTSPSPAEEAKLRDAVGGPPDPETPLANSMTKEVVCVRHDVDLQEVKEILMTHGIGGIPVVDERGKPIGMISRADVLSTKYDHNGSCEVDRWSGGAGQLDSREPPTTDRVTARSSESDDREFGFSYQIYEPERVTAGEAMNPLVFALHERSSIGQAASLMAFEGVQCLPIVSDGGELVGTLSSLDVLRWLGRRSGYLIP